MAKLETTSHEVLKNKGITGITKEKVAQQFVNLYYKILNDYPTYLHQFYGNTSTVVVSEAQDDGTPLTIQADNLEMIKKLLDMMFNDVIVTLTNCTPQFSIDGSVLLVVSGKMARKEISRKNLDEERLFTQAFVLARQTNGFFVRTDTLHVYSKTSSRHILNISEANSTIPKVYNDIPSSTHRECEAQLNSTKIYDESSNPNKYESEMMHSKSFSENDNEDGSNVAENISKVLFFEEKKDEGSSKDNNIIKGDNYVDEPVEPPTNIVAPIEKPPEIQSISKPSKISYAAAVLSKSTAPILSNDKNIINKNQFYNNVANKQTGSSEQIAQAGQHSLFVSHLPKGVTLDEIKRVFEHYGDLSDENSVKLYPGPNNGHACINFRNRDSLQKALEADIRLGNEILIKDLWKPKDSRQQNKSQFKKFER